MFANEIDKCFNIVSKCVCMYQVKKEDKNRKKEDKKQKKRRKNEKETRKRETQRNITNVDACCPGPSPNCPPSPLSPFYSL